MKNCRESRNKQELFEKHQDFHYDVSRNPFDTFACEWNLIDFS